MQLFLLIITGGLLLLYAALLLYYRQAWLSIKDFSVATLGKPYQTKLSVIIPARNEAENISHCLRCLVEQTYPAHLFEVLIINDHSTDQTETLARGFEGKNIRVISLADYIKNEPLNSYKKKAIEIGIQESKGTLIVTTDADCTMHPDWLATIAGFYEIHHPAFIAAPVSIGCANRFIEIFQALDFMSLQGITGASVYKNMHSMCNGANLAYEKAAFYEVDGFKGIDAIASGDDMLLMHKIFEKHPKRVLFLKAKEAIVYTEPVANIREFFNQRIRWASKADKYNDKSLLPVLVVVYFLNVTLFIYPVVALIRPCQFFLFQWHISILTSWVILLLAKIGIELFFLFPVAGFFNRRSLLWLFPLMQPFHILYTIIAGWLGKFGSYRWKGRIVK